MKIPAYISNNTVLVGGVLIVGIAAAWLALRGAKGMGTDLGSGAVNFSLGVVGGVNDTLGIPRTSDVIAWADKTANDPTLNPLHGVGTSLGGWIFDMTHPKGV
jgi:hypothetical protein